MPKNLKNNKIFKGVFLSLQLDTPSKEGLRMKEFMFVCLFVSDALRIFEAFRVGNRRMGDVVKYLRMELGSFYMR